MTTGSDIRAEVLALFNSGYGRAMTLRRITPGAYNRATGETAAPSQTDFGGKAKMGTYKDGVIDGDLIKQGDRLCTFIPDATTTVPQPADLIIDGAATYTVISSKPRELGGDWIAFSLQVR